MFLIILSYYNIYTNLYDLEVFGLYQTIEKAEQSLEKYSKNFSFKSFLINKNNIYNEIYETYPSNYLSTIIDEGIEICYSYKFIIKEYNNPIENKKYSFIPYDDKKL
jgi:hypothetical protein